MLAAVAHDQRWPDVVAGISACFSKFAFVLFLLIKLTKHLTNNQTSLFKNIVLQVT